jgi:hypothetical protein
MAPPVIHRQGPLGEWLSEQPFGGRGRASPLGTAGPGLWVSLCRGGRSSADAYLCSPGGSPSTYGRFAFPFSGKVKKACLSDYGEA